MRFGQIASLVMVATCLPSGFPKLAAEVSTLDSIRREVNEAPRSAPADEPSENGHSDPRSGRNRRSPDSCEDRGHGSFHFGSPSFDECDSTEQAVGWAILFGATTPWWGPHLLLEGDGAGTAAFPIGPYASGHPGYLTIDAGATDAEIPRTKSWGGRVSLDTANNFDDITTMTGRLQLDTVFRVGLDAEWANLVERQPGSADWLGRGDCNLVVRFAQSERMQFHSGVGLNWLADRNTSDYGFNFTYGVDLFPVDPVVASASIDLGTVGNSSLVHFRGTIGLMVRPRLHLYTGYDLLNFEGNSIHSLLTGLEFWF